MHPAPPVANCRRAPRPERRCLARVPVPAARTAARALALGLGGLAPAGASAVNSATKPAAEAV